MTTITEHEAEHLTVLGMSGSLEFPQAHRYEISDMDALCVYDENNNVLAFLKSASWDVVLKPGTKWVAYAD